MLATLLKPGIVGLLPPSPLAVFASPTLCHNLYLLLELPSVVTNESDPPLLGLGGFALCGLLSALSWHTFGHVVRPLGAAPLETT